MLYLLELRDKIKSVYQKYNIYFNVLLKFIFSLMLFLTIKNNIGFDTRLTSIALCIGCAIIAAFVPTSIITLLVLIICSLHLLKISYICTIAFVAVYLVLWLFFLRHASKYGLVFLATPMLMCLGLSYAVPIVFGMTANPIAAIAVFGGTVMYFLLKICISVKTGESDVKPDEILQVYRYIMNEFISNKEMYMYIILLVGIMVLIYLIRTRKFDYAVHVAAIAGVIVNIALFIVASVLLAIQIPVVNLIVWSIVGGIIGFIGAGFIKLLDYSSVENVQFEDDDYYYYVKAVPKLKVTATQNKFMNITEEDDFKVNLDDDDFKQ